MGAEEEKNRMIEDLEREQVALVKKASIVASQALPVGAEPTSSPGEHVKQLEAKVLALQQQLASTERSCIGRRLEVARLRAEDAKACGNCEVLQQTYDKLQRRSDELVLHNQRRQAERDKVY